jgi:hypothetical protein
MDHRRGWVREKPKTEEMAMVKGDHPGLVKGMARVKGMETATATVRIIKASQKPKIAIDKNQRF